jgi:hypothetical protein
MNVGGEWYETIFHDDDGWKAENFFLIHHCVNTFTLILNYQFYVLFEVCHVMYIFFILEVHNC